MNFIKHACITTALLLSAPLTASTLEIGDIFSYSFTPDSLFLTGEVNPDPLSLSFTSGGIVINQALIPATINVQTGESTPFQLIDFSLDIRIYEDNDPLSSPVSMFTSSSTPGEFYNGILFLLPGGTWSDLDGLIEVEVTQGYILGASANVRAESNGFIYSSIAPVPLPASIWLFGSGLIGLGLRYPHKKTFHNNKISIIINLKLRVHRIFSPNPLLSGESDAHDQCIT